MSANPTEPSPSESTPDDADSPAPESGTQLPDWAQQTARRRRLLSRRNAVIAVLALLVVGFAVWLNFPFIPDPVILLTRQPELLINSAGTGAQWTMSGRTLGQTRYAPDAVSEPQGRLLWSTPTGPATLAAPIVSDGRIYLGAHFRIVVLDADTGVELAALPATGPMGNSLALADGRLYYAMPDRRLVARDADSGDILWEYEMGDSASGPAAVASGIVYAGALDGTTYAVNADTGARIWRHETLSEVRAPAAVSGQTAFVASADRSLYALDARTGQERARFRTPAQLVAAPVTANGLVYFVSGGQLYAMEADALEFPGRYAVTRVWSQLWLWGFPLPAPPAQPGDAWRFRPPDAGRTEGIISAPAVTDDGYYVGDLLGNLYAGDALTGELRWTFVAADGIVASPVAVGGLLVFGDKSGGLYGVNRADGTERWRLQLPAGAGVRTDPVYADGRLLVRTDDGALHAVE